MFITIKSIDIIRGKTDDDKYHLARVSETVLIPETNEDRDDIEEFVSQHVPTIEEEHDEEYAPGLTEDGTMSGDAVNDTFVQEMEMRISNLTNAKPYEKSEYSEGQKSGFEYALAIYQDIVKHDIVEED